MEVKTQFDLHSQSFAKRKPTSIARALQSGTSVADLHSQSQSGPTEIRKPSGGFLAELWRRRLTSAEKEVSGGTGVSMAAKLYIVYYSMYGHVEKLAQEIKKGADSVEGVEACLWQVPEILSEEILGKMGAPPKSVIPFIKPAQLADADGLIFGFPTRFGMMAAQFKAFLDATGGLWRGQQLAGKPAGLFFSTGSQGGGQETTALTAITQLAHHGMIFVPIGYTFGSGMFEMDQIKGGSPYGAGTYAGDGTRQPSKLELEQAFHQGKYIAAITKKLKSGA